MEGVDTNPNARTGYKIDEFEVWTSGPSPRNVALATSGARAEGAAHAPQDFADAYSAKLTIDGEYGARWHAASPELTIVLAKPEMIDRVVFSSDRPGAAGRHGIAAFVCEYRIEISLDGQQWTEVASSRDRAVVNDAHRRKRLIDRETTTEELAQWIVAPDNPLTRRVLVNRVWHYHFGTGIVATPSDFGFMGGRPTHPELLDWLAQQVSRHGWRLWDWTTRGSPGTTTVSTAA